MAQKPKYSVGKLIDLQGLIDAENKAHNQRLQALVKERDMHLDAILDHYGLDLNMLKIAGESRTLTLKDRFRRKLEIALKYFAPEKKPRGAQMRRFLRITA